MPFKVIFLDFGTPRASGSLNRVTASSKLQAIRVLLERCLRQHVWHPEQSTTTLRLQTTWVQLENRLLLHDVVSVHQVSQVTLFETCPSRPKQRHHNLKIYMKNDSCSMACPVLFVIFGAPSASGVLHRDTASFKSQAIWVFLERYFQQHAWS